MSITRKPRPPRQWYKEITQDQPRLYGIRYSNRSYEHLWGKNEFNSAFPVSLAMYMMNHNINPYYLALEVVEGSLTVACRQISFQSVFNIQNAEEAVFFFEHGFEPYTSLVELNQLDKVDLIVRATDQSYRRPLEIKLCVLPDSATYNHSQERWGTETVFRMPSTKYCAMSIANSCNTENVRQRIKEIFSCCQAIQSWDNSTEMATRFNTIADAINSFESEYHTLQQPFLMQPIWKTRGRSPLLDTDAFDIIIWSDFAFTRLFIDQALENARTNATTSLID